MAKRPSAPNGYLSNVWDLISDTYSYIDIKGWLDTIDSLLGNLYKDRVPLGTVVAIDGPSLSGTIDTNAISAPAGWAICDGRTLTSGQHDFPSPYAGNTIFLPDYRGRVLVGADTTLAVKTAGTTTTSPGVKGRQGASVGIVPDHFHYYSHVHGVGGIAATETEDASGGNFVDSDGAGSGFNLSRAAHAHQMKRIYTSKGRNPADFDNLEANAPTGLSATPREVVSTQVIATAQASIGHDPSGPGSPGEDLPVDVRELSAGVLFVMKVKKHAGSATP